MKESRLMKRLTAAIVVIALGAPAIAVADSKTDLQRVSIKVDYADLNLEKEAGAKVLYRRLKNASRQACDVRSLTVAGSVKRMGQMQRCYRDALNAAVAKIDNDLVTEIHES